MIKGCGLQRIYMCFLIIEFILDLIIIRIVLLFILLFFIFVILQHEQLVDKPQYVVNQKVSFHQLLGLMVKLK